MTPNGSPADVAITSIDEKVATKDTTIQEGKDKAKAVVAASGLDISDSKAKEASQSDTVNGSPSRKRSRSGSPKPLPDAVPGTFTVKSQRDKALIAHYLAREDEWEDGMIFEEKELELEKQDRLEELKGWKRLSLEQQNPVNATRPGPGGRHEPKHRVPHVLYPDGPKGKYNSMSGWLRNKRRTLRRYVPRSQMEEHSRIKEDLVPIRLEIEQDKLKFRDTFTYNLHEYYIAPNMFAEQLVKDFQIPFQYQALVQTQVTAKIEEQLQEYYPHLFLGDQSVDETLPFFAYKNDELRILVKLNITIGSHTLVDQFEWDIGNLNNSPEEFARTMAKDMSLSGEFTTAIAHQIREQAQMFTKSLYIAGFPFDGRPVDDPDVREAFLPSPIFSVFRPVQSAKDYTPYLYELSDGDLQREELSILRDQRRQKRSVGRRGGPALPDLKDKERTIRSLVLSSVIPGAAESMENARIFKLSRSSGRGRKSGVRVEGGDFTDDEEFEGSDLEAEVLPQVATRGGRIIRNAATAAMRASNIGRSATPEVSSHPHHDNRGLSRRLQEIVQSSSSSSSSEEEEEEEEESLIVKLKVPKNLLRQLAAGVPIDRRGSERSRTGTPRNGTPLVGSPAPGGQWTYDPDGRVATQMPRSGPQPPPPSWLLSALTLLRKKYSQDEFEAQMKLYAMDPTTNATAKPNADGKLPANVRYMFVPRIKCNDCPGKIYNAGPGQTADGFEIHLMNKFHKERVEARNHGGR